MRLAKDALIEIIDIVRNGIATSSDISEKLRSLDLIVDGESNTLKLTKEYIDSKNTAEV